MKKEQKFRKEEETESREEMKEEGLYPGKIIVEEEIEL